MKTFKKLLLVTTALIVVGGLTLGFYQHPLDDPHMPERITVSIGQFSANTSSTTGWEPLRVMDTIIHLDYRVMPQKVPEATEH